MYAHLHGNIHVPGMCMCVRIRGENGREGMKGRGKERGRGGERGGVGRETVSWINIKGEHMHINFYVI